MVALLYRSVPRIANSSPVIARASAIVPRLQTRQYAKDTPDKGDPFQKIPDPSHNDVGPNKRHMVDKGPHDVQAESSHKAHAERATGSTQSQATARADLNNSGEKARAQHPKAPGPLIGMNDERGGKGQ